MLVVPELLSVFPKYYPEILMYIDVISNFLELMTKSHGLQISPVETWVSSSW